MPVRCCQRLAAKKETDSLTAPW
jgi:hypothetical protein